MQIKDTPRRRSVAELKARVLAACESPGASVAAFVRAYDLITKFILGLIEPKSTALLSHRTRPSGQV